MSTYRIDIQRVPYQWILNHGSITTENSRQTNANRPLVTNQSDATSFDLNTIDKTFINDPYPTLANLREHDPVHFNPDGSLYLTRYEDVRAVYQDRTMVSDKTVAFKDKFGEGPLYTHHTTSLIFNDPPYHTTVRKLLAHAFTPRKLAEMEPIRWFLISVCTMATRL